MPIRGISRSKQSTLPFPGPTNVSRQKLDEVFNFKRSKSKNKTSTLKVLESPKQDAVITPTSKIDAVSKTETLVKESDALSSFNPSNLCSQSAPTDDIKNFDEVKKKSLAKKTEALSPNRPTLFLYHGPSLNLGTSNEGMYGEIAESGLIAIAKCMEEYGLDDQSVILDLGSGRGAPSAIFAYFKPIFASIGIEKCEQAYMNSVNITRTLLIRSLEAILKRDGDIMVDMPDLSVGFANEDLTAYNHFNGVTHFYSFDAAMEGALINNMVFQFTNTQTAWLFASFHGDLISKFELPNCELVQKFSTNMLISREGRQCYIYVKKDWKKIKSEASHYLKSNVISKKGDRFQISKWNQPLTALDLIRLSKSSWHCQYEWYMQLYYKLSNGIMTRSRRNSKWGFSMETRRQESKNRDRVIEAVAQLDDKKRIKKLREQLSQCNIKDFESSKLHEASTQLNLNLSMYVSDLRVHFLMQRWLSKTSILTK